MTMYSGFSHEKWWFSSSLCNKLPEGILGSWSISFQEKHCWKKDLICQHGSYVDQWLPSGGWCFGIVETPTTDYPPHRRTTTYCTHWLKVSGLPKTCNPSMPGWLICAALLVVFLSQMSWKLAQPTAQSFSGLSSFQGMTDSGPKMI